MSLVGKLRERAILRLANERCALYEQFPHPEQHHSALLDRLNRMWGVAIEHVPRYREMVATSAAPRHFESLVQFSTTVPALTKLDIQTQGDSLCDERRPTERMYTTGGSTGSPTSIHGWNREIEIDNINRWLGRSMYGIRPSDSCFLIWGHHHLLGKGPKARLRAAILSAKDTTQHRIRFNAYNLNEDRAREAGDLILRHKPAYLIGYSSALDLIARVNKDRTEQFAALNLKASIACAESYPREDSAKMISSTFGCPAAMEYGAVETHITAYTLPSSDTATAGYRVFWLDHMYELGEPGPGGGQVLRITCLYERKTPLIRYEIGDEVIPIEAEPLIGPGRIGAIRGRVNSIITLSDGKAVHTTAISRAISDRSDVRQFQIVDRPSGLAIRIVASSDDAKEAIALHVRRNLLKISPTLKDAPIEFVGQIAQSIAGKTPLILREE